MKKIATTLFFSFFISFFAPNPSAMATTTEPEKKQAMEISPEMKAAMEKMADKKTEVSDNLTNIERFQKYVKSGFVHILPLGLDHILFVLALFFSTRRYGNLVLQITAFTIAHSITLFLASYGVINISGDIVEPLIALSIAWMAIGNIISEEKGKANWWVIIVFGLLHGLGFASVLGDFGLPQSDFLMSLLAFNIGVELGQITVLLGALVAFYWWSKKPSYRMFAQIPFSLIIAIIGLYWTVERIL